MAVKIAVLTLYALICLRFVILGIMRGSEELSENYKRIRIAKAVIMVLCFILLAIFV